SLNQAKQEPGKKFHYQEDMMVWETHSQKTDDDTNAKTTQAREQTKQTPAQAQRKHEPREKAEQRSQQRQDREGPGRAG
ncbi:hypothetical protein ACOIDL_28325, partial [Klebsiella pneumoniae]